MKLVASMLVHNEFGRYLRQSVTHALTYCDEVRVIDDRSTDGGYEWLAEQDRVALERNPGPPWATEGGHEGKVRQALLDHALASGATHVIALDADELISNGRRLRQVLSRPRFDAVALRVVEVWGLDPWQLRVDGGWVPRFAPVAFRVPTEPEPDFRAYDLRLACPREPQSVSRLFGTRQCRRVGVDLIHLGWANPEEREARAARYHTLDRGEFHAREHLDSILWKDKRLQLIPYESPADVRALFAA